MFPCSEGVSLVFNSCARSRIKIIPLLRLGSIVERVWKMKNHWTGSWLWRKVKRWWCREWFSLIFEVYQHDPQKILGNFLFLFFSISFERVHYTSDSIRSWVSNESRTSQRNILQRSPTNLVLFCQHTWDSCATSKSSKHFLQNNSWVGVFYLFLLRNLGTIFCACVETWSVATKTLQLLLSEGPRLKIRQTILWCRKFQRHGARKLYCQNFCTQLITIHRMIGLSTMKIALVLCDPLEYHGFQVDMVWSTAPAFSNPVNIKPLQSYTQVVSENHSAEIVLNTQEISRPSLCPQRWSSPSKESMTDVLTAFAGTSFATRQRSFIQFQNVLV